MGSDHPPTIDTDWTNFQRCTAAADAWIDCKLDDCKIKKLVPPATFCFRPPPNGRTIDLTKFQVPDGDEHYTGQVDVATDRVTQCGTWFQQLKPELNGEAQKS